MNKKMINLIILLIIGSAIGATGQILLKTGVNELGLINITPTTLLYTIFRILTNGFVFLGLLLSGIAAFTWIIVLSGNSLSFAYPLGTAFFCLAVLVLSIFLLREKISPTVWIGAFIVIFGIIIISLSRR